MFSILAWTCDYEISFHLARDGPIFVKNRLRGIYLTSMCPESGQFNFDLHHTNASTTPTDLLPAEDGVIIRLGRPTGEHYEFVAW